MLLSCSNKLSYKFGENFWTNLKNFSKVGDLLS